MVKLIEAQCNGWWWGLGAGVSREVLVKGYKVFDVQRE